MDSSEIALTLNGAQFSEGEDDFVHVDLVVGTGARLVSLLFIVEVHLLDVGQEGLVD